MGSIFLWWFVVLVLGLAAFPITFITLKHLPDKGYFFSKVLGLLLVAYFSWLLGHVAFNGATLFLAFAIVCALSGLVLWSWIGKAFFAFFRKNAFFFLVVEGLFLIIFLVAGVYKMRAYEIVGTEKPMDFAFINGILASPSMPPNDPWLSGGHISYYYFGYVIAAILCRITGVAPGEAFNLDVALTWALAAVGAFSLAYALTRRYRYSLFSMGCLAIFGNMDYWHRAIQSFIFGNLRQPYYNQPADPAAAKGFAGFFGFLFSPFQHGWDYFQASRIMTVPGSTDKMINEFPSFSFFLSDLHPHVMAIPFVLLALALAFNLLKAPLPGLQVFGGRNVWQWFQWFLYAAVFGGLSFLNSWDFPTFTFLLGLCLFLQQWWAQQADFKTWFKSVALVGIPIVIGSFLLYIPFYSKFQSQAQGIGLVGDRTNLYHLVVIFGLFFTILIPALAGKVLRLRSEKPAKSKGKNSDIPICSLCGAEESGRKFCGACGGEMVQISGGEVTPVPNPFAQSFMNKIASLFSDPKNPSWGWMVFGACSLALLLLNLVPIAGQPLQMGTLFLALLCLTFAVLSLAAKAESREMVFVLLLCVVGFLLIAGCEVFYLRDLFAGSLYRMNSIFKFHYQVWILFSIASGPFLKWIFENQWPQWATWRKIAWGGVAGFAFLGAFLYPVLAFASRMNGSSADMATLDGAAYYEHTFPADYQVAEWIRANVRPSNGKVPVILESWGDSYHQDHDGVSVLTGYPTVLGWAWHEVQWRGSSTEPAIRGGDADDTIKHRQDDIDAIYTSADLNQTKALLRKYGVDFVYLGDSERAKYNNSPNLAKFAQLGTPVYQAGNSVLYKLNP